MYELKPDITLKYILERVTQEQIFEHYLNTSVVYGQFFCSTLRSDKNPTCSFKRMSNGTIVYRDWAEPKGFTCFSLVQYIYNCTFWEALQYIYVDMLIDNKKPQYIFVEPEVKEIRKSDKSDIQVKFDSFQPEVKQYLTSYGITTHQCKKFNIFPIKHVFLNGKLFWTYNKYDPAIAYYFGDNNNSQRWKIYFFARKNKYRFLCNTNRINGWIQLPSTGDTLIITKSLKDVACLDMFNIPAIAMQNETTLPYDYIIEELQSRFTNIYSLYDYDRTGIHLASELEQLYNIKPLFFKNVSNVKDFSDYIKHNGKPKTERLISYVKKYLEQNKRTHK